MAQQAVVVVEAMTPGYTPNICFDSPNRRIRKQDSKNKIQEPQVMSCLNKETAVT